MPAFMGRLTVLARPERKGIITDPSGPEQRSRPGARPRTHHSRQTPHIAYCRPVPKADEGKENRHKRPLDAAGHGRHSSPRFAPFTRRCRRSSTLKPGTVRRLLGRTPRAWLLGLLALAAFAPAAVAQPDLPPPTPLPKDEERKADSPATV